MKKLILAVVCAVVLLFATNAFSYDIDDAIGDKLGSRQFELFGANVNKAGNTLNIDIFSNYKDPLTVGAWHTFTGDLALDLDRDNVYEYGVAFSDHDGLTKGGLYSVTSWYKSDDYAPSPAYSYNHDKIVTINGGSLITTGALNWNTLSGINPDYRVGLSLDLSNWQLPSNWNGNANLFFASATCANDYLQGSVHVTPEPISAALFLLGGGALAVRQYRRKNKKV